MLNRWRVGTLCALCFDVEAERAKAHCAFVNVSTQSRNEHPTPAGRTSGSGEHIH
jgi:hypothetical protein